MHIEAVVIRKRPVREHDQLVVLYSREYGKLGALAKGSLRRHSMQALSLDEGNLIRCELVAGRSGPIVTGAQAVRTFSGAKRSPVAWAAVQFFLQAADTIIYDGQPDELLWHTLTATLTELDAAVAGDMLGQYRTGQRRLLEALGYGRPSESMQDRWIRSELDERFEAIAQRKLSSIDLLYDVAATSGSW